MSEEEKIAPSDEEKKSPNEEEKKSLNEEEKKSPNEEQTVNDLPVTVQTVVDDTMTEEIMSEWLLGSFNVPSTFRPLDSEIIGKIEQESSNISPIIREMFETIYQICVNGFNFSAQKISIDKYKEFYMEVNRIIPKLKQKIIEEECPSDVFYVGDTHGSIEDSFLIIDFFYKLIQKDSKVKIVFIGDYVDRNPWDLENLTLILAFALLCPKNVVLLRGNHEDKTINTHYGFIDNLLRAFWDAGEELYQEILKFFTHLPLIHISNMLDNSGKSAARILSTHGGIPIDPFNFLQPFILKDLEEKLNCEQERSEDMDMLSVSILWSDPDEMIQGIINDGDTGRMRFGFPVFDAFMKANGLHLHVRGHQKWNDGSKTFFNNQLYSLFSTSKYDNKKHFNPKILQLSLKPPKPPQVIEIEPSKLAMAYENYQK